MSTDKPAKHAQIYRMVTSDHICPFGIKSRDLLKRKGFVVEDHHLKNREETEQFKEQYQVKTTPQTFIDGKRIGGYDDLKAYFGIAAKKDTTYTPVIAIFAMALAIALALSLAHFESINIGFLVQTFIASSMCLLAVQKLKDLSAFSLQFVSYDLIAMRYVPYAYIYAYLEAFAGIGMLANFPAWLVAPPALLIGSIGALSVIKAVYIDKRDLKCACVGGNSKVPLGAVSLSENLIMVAAALWMLART